MVQPGRVHVFVVEVAPEYWKLPPVDLTSYDNAVSSPTATYTFTTPGIHTISARALT